MTPAFKSGFVAFKAGHGEGTNPYDEWTKSGEWQQWNDGWTYGYNRKNYPTLCTVG